MFLVSIPGNSQQTPLPEQGAPPTTLTERDGYVSANNAPPSTESFEVHVVEEGDTLWDIARAFETSVEALKSWNDIQSPASLRAGKRIRVREGEVAE